MSFLHAVLMFSLMLWVPSTWAQQANLPRKLRAGAEDLVHEIQTLADHAKKDGYLSPLRQDLLGLQTKASDLLQSGKVPKCETNLVIKMAAAGIGSHEVLTVMLAKDNLAVLNGRLALSLAFLEQVAQQLEDELSLSGEVGGHLSAIVFGANTLVSIIDTADKTVKAMRPMATITKEEHGTLGRRQLKTSYDLGNGFSVGLGGLKWESSSGSTTFNLKPTFNGFKPNGVHASIGFRF